MKFVLGRRKKKFIKYILLMFAYTRTSSCVIKNFSGNESSFILSSYSASSSAFI